MVVILLGIFWLINSVLVSTTTCITVLVKACLSLIKVHTEQER